MLAIAAPVGMNACAEGAAIVELGPVKAQEVRDLVTAAFIQRFPAEQWSIFLSSSAGRTSQGASHCSAVAGVAPAGSSKFPIPGYVQSGAQASVPADASPHNSAAACARGAVQNLMVEH
ncbi:MAG: hypothetical protein FWD62_09175 [Betaproteobacteria bacterium]|nr:hypothetical protein [Betaproteobacteria bacterium]